MFVRTILAGALALALARAQAPPPPQPQDQQQKRDLKIEKDPTVTNPVVVSTPRPTAHVTIPNSYALVIGVSKYQDSALTLAYPERDADAIYSILISPEGGNFPAQNVHELTGAQATRANIHKYIEEWLPSVAKDDDRVLIYFAGHGFIYKGNGYLAPYDFDRGNPETSGYSMDTLGKTFGGKIKGKWKVLLTDSCHSGAITPETSNEAINSKLLSLDRSLFSLTASRDRERSFEGPQWGGGHGVFTYYVVEGLQGSADENGDGIVSADELADYVRTNVREATQTQQNPTSDKGSFDAAMLLAFNPSDVKPGQRPAPKNGTLIFDSNQDSVELFVDDVSKGVLFKGKPFALPGLIPGKHIIKAVKMGYEPDGPREEMVYPGQDTTVKIRILILRHRDKAATDAFDKGVQLYAKGFEANYRKAIEQFDRAVQIDPKYSAAYLYLGRSYNALFDEDKAKASYKRAIEIDPDFLEARASYAGMLLDIGDTQGAIEQLTFVTQRDKSNTEAFCHLAEAYRMTDAFQQAIDSAHQAIATAPNNGEAHFWLAESLRENRQYDVAETEYEQYLKLSDFDSKLAGKLNYYVLGYLIGFGHKSHASQEDIWRDLRSLAYFGLCDCDRKLKRYDPAIEWCRQSLTYSPKDANVHLALGYIYARKAESSGSLEMLAAADQQLRTVLTLNPDIENAGDIQKMLASFEKYLLQAKVKN